MTDNQLIALLASQLDAASAMAGWNYIVVQKNSPDQQGVPNQPTIFFEKLFDHPYGSPKSSLALNAGNMDFTETNIQWYESRVQVSSLVPQDPSDLTLPTASDVVNYVKMYIASRTSRAVFMQQNVGILRVTEVRNPYFEDDKERMEAHPSFDLILTYQRTLDILVPGTNIVQGAVVSGIQQQGVFPVVP